MKRVIRYSEAFKLKVVRELEEGRFDSPSAVGQAYGVNGHGTVAYWVRKYGKNHILKRVVRVMKADEQAEVIGLRKQVRDLKAALADAHLDLRLESAYLKLACRTAGIEDVDTFKKKNVGKQ